MVTVKWHGTFVREGKPNHESHQTFVGKDLTDVNRQIHEFVKCIEDGGLKLIFNETVHISYEK